MDQGPTWLHEDAPLFSSSAVKPSTLHGLGFRVQASLIFCFVGVVLLKRYDVGFGWGLAASPHNIHSPKSSVVCMFSVCRGVSAL